MTNDYDRTPSSTQTVKQANRRAQDFYFMTGREWQSLPTGRQDAYVERAFAFWRRQGFPYYDFDRSQIRELFRRLAMSQSQTVYLKGNWLQASTVGIGLANSFHPQMWNVKFSRCRTPLDCFNDDALLRACLRQALNLWPNRRGASPNVLRDILRTFRHTRRVSNFRPAVAKALYERYSEVGDRVLDFSAGYGGRLLACLTLRRHYVGYDPCSLQIKGLNRMYQAIDDLGLAAASVELHQACAEELMRSESSKSFDLIFTSPPYFDRERYSAEPTQSFLRYPSYPEWREKFLYVVIRESHRLLRSKGLLILNVSDFENAPIASDAVKLSNGLFELCVMYRMRMSTLPFHRANGADHFRYEPVFVLGKR